MSQPTILDRYRVVDTPKYRPGAPSAPSGSLASTTEDAQRVAGPEIYLPLIDIWASPVALSGASNRG